VTASVRIAIVSEHYYPQLGGITEHAYGQASELARRGHEVTLITPRLLLPPRPVDAAPPREERFEIVRVGRAYPFYINASEARLAIGPLLASALGRAFARRRFDVVHVHNPFGVAMPIIAVMRSKAPVTVGTVHSVVPAGYKLLRLFRRPLQIVFARLDARIAVSEAVVDSIQPHFPGLSFEVIPNGVDTNFFSPKAAPLPHLDGMRNLLFLGRFDPRNGLKHMLRTFSLLREVRDDVRLVVLGDGPLRGVYQRLVPDGLRADVLFEGRVDQLRPRYLASAEILCTPCQLASFGMVLLEGMSAGRPVVASRNSGFARLMENGRQGFLIDPPDDERKFAAALNLLLEDSDLARSMGAAGRQLALTTYAWPNVVDRLEELYERLLTEPTGRARAAKATPT
jgi:phosphatidyl-myo-inositol alpha-mannosyltransferase